MGYHRHMDPARFNQISTFCVQYLIIPFSMNGIFISCS